MKSKTSRTAKRPRQKTRKVEPFWAKRGGICHVEFKTPDLDAAAKFYGAVFGWVSHPAEPGAMFFALQTVGDALCPMAIEGRPRAGSTVIYVNVEDIGATLARAKKLGAEVVRPETDLGGHGACAELRAPDGNVFGIWRAQR